MRRRNATSRITLKAKALPKSAENTELNYRTCITTPGQDTETTIRLVSGLTLFFIVIGFGLRVLTFFPLIVSGPLFFILFLAVMALAHWKFLRGRPTATDSLIALVLIGVSVLFGLVTYAPTMRSAYVLIFGTALLIAAAFSHSVTVQACAFMAVNERVPRLRMRRWLKILSRVDTQVLSVECPEVTSYGLNFFLLIANFALGFGVLTAIEATELRSYAAILGAIGFVVSLPILRLLLAVLGWTPAAPLKQTARVTWDALKTFVCYNRHQVEAAGLFRFPTKALRPPLVRDLFLGVTLAFLTTAFVGVSVASPWVLIDEYRASPRKPEAKPEEFKLTPTEEQFARTLPAGQQSQYFEAKKREHTGGQAESRWDGARRTALTAFITIIIVIAVCWIGPIVVLFAVFWFIGGELLNRYYQALEAPDAYELPPKRTKEELEAGEREVSTWDNRIDRMRRSRDKLETEHFYLGSSIEGDFPVLLHQDLLQRNAHILGDSASRKTSIGIAPLVTQLIDRENCSIVILDMGADRSLFNAARDEAAGVGMPFKWFTNIGGKSSFVFNPLRQGYVEKATSSQLAQVLLQALDIDHGHSDGRGIHSAIDDLVLGAYLRTHREHVGSFHELHGLLTDRDAYRSIGNDEDWKRTRQLSHLLEKLARLGPVNGTAETMKAKPRVIEEQIDMASVLRKPQVVYFYLSPTLDTLSVAPIARLALFSLLAASEFRDGKEPRTYVFVDDFQRVITDATKLFFENAHKKGIHFILANQSIGQLTNNRTNILETIETTTGFTQSFKATDRENIKRIIETSGDAVYHSLSWKHIVTDAFNENSPELVSLEHALRKSPDGVEVNVSERIGPRMEKNTLIEVSALPLASVVKFTEGSGYTQYSGDWTTVLSEYHISKSLYQYYEGAALPPVDDRTVEVAGESPQNSSNQFYQKPIPNPPKVPDGFDDELERRANQATNKPPKTSDTGRQNP